MADRETVVRYIREFSTHGEQSWVAAARQQERADLARTKATAGVADAQEKANTVGKRSVATTKQQGSAAAGAARDYAVLERQILAFNTSQGRALVQQGVQQEKLSALTKKQMALEKESQRVRQSSARTASRSSAGGQHMGIGGVALGGFLVAGGAAAGVISATKAYATYNQTLTEAQAVSGATAKQIHALDIESKHLGASYGMAANQVAGAGKDLLYGGVAVSKLGQALHNTTILAKAGGEPIANAADTVAKAIAVFKLSGAQSGLVVDSITNAAAHTTGTIASFSEGLDTAGAAAHTLHMGLGQTVTLLDLLQKAGRGGAEGGTTLKTALIHLANPTKQAQKTLDKYHLSLFTTGGRLKSISALSTEFHTKLKGLNDQQVLQVEASLAGQRGFAALAAIMGTTGPKAAALEKAITKQGTAAQLAEGNLKGYAAQWSQIKAQGGNFKLDFGEQILKGVEGSSGGLLRAMKSPGLESGVNQLGAQIGSELGRGVSALTKGLEDGSVQRDLSQVATAGSEVVTVLSEVTGVGLKLVGVVAQIPSPIVKAVAAFAAWRLVTGSLLNNLGGIPRALGGVEAAAASATRGKFGAGAATSAGAASGGYNVVSGSLRQRYAAFQEAGAARQAALQAEQLARTNRSAAARVYSGNSNTIGWMGAAPESPLVIGMRDQALARDASLREQSAASQRALATASARRQAASEERLAARNSLLRTPGKFSVIGGAAAGIGGGLLAGGGNPLTGAMAGAGIGSFAGPEGMAIGAAGGAIVSEIQGYFKGQALKEATAIGDNIAQGAGKGLAKPVQQHLTKLAIAYNSAQKAADTQAMYGGRVDSKTADRVFSTNQALMRATNSAQKAHGRQVGESFGSGSDTASSFLNTTALEASYKRATAKLVPAAQAAAAKPALAYVRSLEAAGRLSKGAADRFAKAIGANVASSVHDQTVTANIRVKYETDIAKAAGGARAKILSDLKREKLAFPLEVTAAKNTGFDKIVATARTRMAELKQIMHGATGATHAEQVAASKEYATLAQHIADFQKKAAPAIQTFRSDTAAALAETNRHLEATGTAADQARKSMLKLARVQIPAFQIPLNGAVPVAAPRHTTPRTPVHGHSPVGTVGVLTSHRRGGEVRRSFRGGGMVPIAVSPGEHLFDPGGGYMGEVPGPRTAADSVHMMAPEDGTVLTGDGWNHYLGGASLEHATQVQRPHFREGGPIPRFAAGGGIGPARAANVNKAAGFRGRSLVEITAIEGAESGWTPGEISGLNTDGSRDYGLSQVNNKAHPNYFRTAGEILQPLYNAKAAFAISNHGSSFQPWTTWNTGAYRRFMSQAQTAATRATGNAGTFGSTTTTVPVLRGASTAGRGPLVDDAFSQGFQSGLGGYSLADREQYGSPILATLGSALSGVKTTRKITVSGGGSAKKTAAAGSGPRGTTVYKGVTMASWVADSLRTAARKGVAPQPTSGYRPGRDRHTASGRSEHQGKVYPHGAVDFGSFTSGLAAKMSVVNATRGTKYPLLAPVGFRDDGHASGTGHRRGGLIRRFRGGGVIKPVGGVNVQAGLQKGGDGFYSALGSAIDNATLSRMNRIAAQLAAVAAGSGSATLIAHAQAALAVVDEAIGARFGRVFAHGSELVAGRAASSTITSAQQRIAHVDPNSASAIGQQMASEQRFQAAAVADYPKQLNALAKLRAEADAPGLTKTERQSRLETYKTADQNLKDFSAQVLESQATLADLTAAQQQAVLAEQQATRAAPTATNDLLDSQQHVADSQAILDGGQANAAADIAGTQRDIATIRSQLADAISSNDTADQQKYTDALGGKLDELIALQQAANQETVDAKQAMADATLALAQQLQAANAAAARGDLDSLLAQRGNAFVGAFALAQRGIPQPIGRR